MKNHTCLMGEWTVILHSPNTLDTRIGERASAYVQSWSNSICNQVSIDAHDRPSISTWSTIQLTSQSTSWLILSRHYRLRASGRSRKKSQISRDFQGQIRGQFGQQRPISQKFHRNFLGQFHWKTIGKERPISWELPKQILLESDWFCANLRKVFNGTRRSYSIYSGFIPQYEIILYKEAYWT